MGLSKEKIKVIYYMKLYATIWYYLLLYVIICYILFNCFFFIGLFIILIFYNFII